MNSVCKDLYSALCCETKWMNLTIAILDFDGGSELSKHLSKCLLRMRKTQKIEPDPHFFLWWMKVSEAVCKCDWHSVRSYLFFNVQKFWTLYAMAFSPCMRWSTMSSMKMDKKSWWHCTLHRFLSHLMLSKMFLMVCAHQKWINYLRE